MADIFFGPLKRSYEFNRMIQGIREGNTPIHASGLVQSQKAHMACALFEQIECRSALVVAYSELDAKIIYEDARFYAGEKAVYMPSSEMFFYSMEARDRSEEIKRVQALSKIAKGERCILVVSVEALLKKYIPKDILIKSIIGIDANDTLDVQWISAKLSRMGYEREAKVEGAGQFSVRGGIIDIFSPGYEYPVRIELFGDEIDSMRSFDPISQKSLEKINSFEILPAREIVYEDHKPLLEGVEDEIAGGNGEDALRNIQMIRDGIYFEGIENYVDYIYEKPDTLISYLPKDSLVIMNEPSRITERERNYREEFNEIFLNSFEKGYALQGQSDILLGVEDIMDDADDRPVVLMSMLPKDVRGFGKSLSLNFAAREIHPFGAKRDMFISELKYLKDKGHSILISIGDKDAAKNIYDMVESSGLACSIVERRDADLKPSQIAVTIGGVASGFSYTDAAFTLITDKEVLGAHKKGQEKRKKKIKNARQIESFLELSTGDYVVHESHGIGKYEGMSQLAVGDIKKDYLKITYAGSDSLYVPTDQLDKVQKYIGSDGERVKLSKLGSNEWNKVKKKTQKAVEDMAKELVELYAKREERKGYSFAEDTTWQGEFENLFPYEETEDQKKAIEEVKRDMESDRIMDRLICGDVGYGKTEVAIRAVFKACMESKQVALLVPTTILAQQHYVTFAGRFENFPIRVEVLSRFKTEKQQKQIIEDARKGLVDVLIGTHRILSKDISFKDLGLLVIDEEQRFGVKHKEKIKKVKETVDVLALSATPIPRTLHMSLTGIRDMSVIEEPPEERHPVRTFVVEAKESIMADAIEREIARGGQVFFVYNRVNGIEDIAAKIKSIVPSANVDLGHGQMSSRQLEKVMMRFLQKETNVLVCTTIIETGMDISNANTIIVYDADKMGLSQLYQLRGRVGRSSRQAYAYFAYEKDKVLSEVSEKRLKAIKEFTEFGSGFKIAMRDLEIRGAGNLLGSQQHGHMASIGYDLYVKMLSNAIKRLKGEEVVKEADTEIELKLEAYIPQDYIDDESTKIEIYKKIASIEDKKDMYEIQEEIEDRFSDIPLPVGTLIMAGYAKALGKKLDVKAIRWRDDKILIEPYYMFRPKEKNHYKLITEIAEVMEKMIK
ncbi:transcription-repair coupling factor (superfamily II helicase) [Peptoclostridium litorale DSM 5388]|uniref:Transcription-repair-coupling factor n=1 Tax=Peptoclostridium litorale DSM 5388 TaxID=1121324 RepID=A0A069RJ18_PEPLI|nr:transcription-repair coupling factor [Peptoclostridium litorale]KDR94242.1 transcription-repair-coupling factor Mfd [Peptoclostridium litorale DSM 5388]SIO28040.1 transcription-repair coupling factor (superfamily II helicase) [Peptoclostridium litorale DSM 5388]